jgi:hypothetical protein
MKITKRQLRRIIREEKRRLNEGGLAGHFTGEAPPGDQEIRDVLLPLILRLKSEHGKETVAGVLESFVLQLKKGFV